MHFRNQEANPLPGSSSPRLELSHPTPSECVKIWTNTSTAWSDALDLQAYLLESQFLTSVPLARDGRMATWVLVDKELPPDRRPTLCSCESFRKRALASDASGDVEEVIVHAVASVFCPPEYRNRGYASRHMGELAKVLRGWQQSDEHQVFGSILYSDIGKDYYARSGWLPNRTNTHVEFPAERAPKSPVTQQLAEEYLAALCERDEVMIRAAMKTAVEEPQKRFTILPDIDHMLWHIRKADFATRHLFGKTPHARGAIAGPPGSQVWAIWTHRYYERPDAGRSKNVLYILRLVVERDGSANGCLPAQGCGMDDDILDEQMDYLSAVLQAAQTEAAEWQLDHVKLWEPSPWVRGAIARLGLSHSTVERQEESIASFLCYNEHVGRTGLPPTWINNEHYAWC